LDAPPLQTRRRDPLALGLAAVVGKALQREPARRHRSAQELRDELLHLRNTSSAGVLAANIPASPTGQPRREAAALRRFAPSPTALMFALLMIAAWISAWRGPLTSQEIQRADPPQQHLAAIVLQ
jgi:hypothetical protein